jgi:hypothetical protein
MLSSLQTKNLLPLHAVQDISLLRPEDLEQTKSNKFYGSLRRLQSLDKIAGDKELYQAAA